MQLVFIDPGLTIEGIDGNITEASVLIRNVQQDEDTLHYTTVNGINGTYNPKTGILSLSGATTAVNYQNALRSITFSTTSLNTENRIIDFVLGSGLYFQGTGHFYEYVSGGGTISWENAKTAAESRSFYGRKGYLVTITSAAENEFVRSKTLGLGWIGARDIAHPNGDWRWVTGPEGLQEGGGFKFWSGYHNSANNGKTPNTAYLERYANWQSGEPNNWSGEEFVAHIYGPGANHGQWNFLQIIILLVAILSNMVVCLETIQLIFKLPKILQ